MTIVDWQDISKIEFQDYESVRVSGVTNMFDRRTVQELSGLDQATITEIMSHYKDFMVKYPQVRK